MTSKPLASMRISYNLASLGDREVLADPIAQFTEWFEEVSFTEIIEANAMIVATVSADGMPQARTVLMKDVDSNGIVFYTNYHSAKGRQIEANPAVCALFYWPSLQRQVRWTGMAERVSPEQSDAYFASRPRGSQLGAIASNQSRPVESAKQIHDRYEELAASYAAGNTITRPDHWGGYRIRPTAIEFWQGRENRLHDRILFTISTENTWDVTRLEP